MAVLLLAFTACKKEKKEDQDTVTYQHYEVGFKRADADWRDTAFIVRTNNPQLIAQADAQLALPVNSRKLVTGKLVSGSGGYNRNGVHEFSWHFKEDDWQLADVTVEIYDGKPYTDIDQNLTYWINTVQRYGSWGSYIRRKL